MPLSWFVDLCGCAGQGESQHQTSVRASVCLLGLTGRALKYAKSGAGEGSRKGFFVSVSVSVSLSVSISLRLHSSLFFVHVVVALALFVGFSCCCFFHSPSRLSDFQVMSFFCCPPLGWTVLLMDCCQVKVMSYVDVCPCVCQCVFVLGCGSGDGLCLYYKGY